MVFPDYREFANLWERYERIPVYKELMVDTLTPSLFLIKMASNKLVFLLESANLKKNFSRYTFFGTPEIYWSIEGDPFSFLKSFEQHSPSFQNFGSFTGGVVGLMGYGACNYTGLLRRNVKEGCDAGLFMFVEEFYVLDNFAQRIYACVSQKKGVSPQQDYKEALEKLNRLDSVLKNCVPQSVPEVKDNFRIHWEYSEGEFKRRVSSIKEEITSGEAIQVVFSQKAIVENPPSPVAFYRMLRKINPSPYMFFLKFPEGVYCGSSPEVHLKVVGKKAFMKPIAGTYPVAKDLEAVISALKKDEKELAEHLMLVDLARNDLYTYCEPESVNVPKFMEAEVYSHVVHLVSSVIGRLKEDIHPVDLLRMTFPAGTVSGAPKVRAIELIDEYELSARDFYAGCVGYLSFSGNLDTCITIRSAKFVNNIAILRAGAGIVYDSSPEKEFLEVKNKLQALVESLKRSAEMGVVL